MSKNNMSYPFAEVVGTGDNTKVVFGQDGTFAVLSMQQVAQIAEGQSQKGDVFAEGVTQKAARKALSFQMNG